MIAEPFRDRKFRHELFPGSPALVALSEETIAVVLQHEAANALRRRKRRTADLEAFRNAVAVIVANLAHVIAFPGSDTGAVILPLGHPRGHRADHLPGFRESLKATVEALEAVGVLSIVWPDIPSHATALRPTEAFRREVHARDIGAPSDFLRRLVLDPVCLTRKDTFKRREELTVPAGVEADTIRAEVRVFNAWLARADIDYDGPDMIDTDDRLLRRRFNLPPRVEDPCLRYGGRLFGGFWQTMKRSLRGHIRIDGEPIAELDYGQILPRLAYASVGAEPPPGDLYDLDLPGPSDVQRCVLKKAFNTLLFSARRLRAWPLEIADALPDLGPDNPVSVARFRRALLRRHPALRPVLENGVGHALMHMESRVLCGVLRECTDKGIVVLPIHDAVLCPVSAVPAVKTIMETQALLVCGCSIPVEAKPLSGADLRPSSSVLSPMNTTGHPDLLSAA
ncbi:hypothetical protein [Breoghania sp.]|uniref:hypothetical protein n=1 Tax=Breoghania sp. TaxID=2065378 RepID=UPI002AA8315F|nr:hypothetical protein [Breoghania sp.]